MKNERSPLLKIKFRCLSNEYSISSKIDHLQLLMKMDSPRKDWHRPRNTRQKFNAMQCISIQLGFASRKYFTSSI